MRDEEEEKMRRQIEADREEQWEKDQEKED